VIVCTDLDRTLIYSAAALDLRVPDAEAPRLLCGAWGNVITPFQPDGAFSMTKVAVA